MKIIQINKLHYNYPLVAGKETHNIMPHNTYRSVQLALAYGYSKEDFVAEFLDKRINDPKAILKTTTTPMLFNPKLGNVAMSVEGVSDSIALYGQHTLDHDQYASWLFDSRAENTLSFLKANVFNNLFPQINTER